MVFNQTAYEECKKEFYSGFLTGGIFGMSVGLMTHFVSSKYCIFFLLLLKIFMN